MRRNEGKNFWRKIAAGVLAISFGGSLAACGATDPTDLDDDGGGGSLTGEVTESAYLAMDINPSVELLIEDGKVVSVNGVNDDADTLLAGEVFIGLTAEEAAEKIVELSELLGYLNTSNTSVKITVAADDEAYAQEVEKDAKEGAEKGSELAEVNSNPRSADNRQCKKLKEENPTLYKDMTPAKVRIIEAIMRYDETMTFEIGVKMKMSELMELLEEYVESYGEMIGDELEDRFGEKLDEARLEKERRIAEIYGEEYLALWEKVQALKAEVREIEKAAENVEISAAHVAQIAELLNIADLTVLEENGVVTVDSIDEYIDKFLDDDFLNGALESVYEAIEEAVETIIELYDEDEYVLTETDLAAIATAWGEAIDVETVEELEEFLKTQEKALKDLFDSIQLTDAQKAQIEAIRGEIKGVFDKVREDMKTEIQNKKQEFENKKKDRMQQHGGGNGAGAPESGTPESSEPENGTPENGTPESGEPESGLDGE